MRHFWIALLTALVLSASGTAQDNHEVALLEKLDSLYEKIQKEWDVPGMSVAVVKDGEIIFSKGYGVKEAGKIGRPDGHTLYPIASNSKAFTASVIGQLVDDGLCNWNDKVQQYLPWFQVYDPAVSSQVTLRDLLSHRVGYGTFSGDIIWYKSDLKAEQIVRNVRHLPPAFEFRDGYGYSNIMYIAAGEVIKAITGKGWYENVKERFLHPLGMERTTISTDDLEQAGNFATPHARLNERNIPIKFTDWSEIAAMGGLISSANEMAKWMIFNMNHGRQNGKQLLSENSLNTIWTPHNYRTVDHMNPNDLNNHFSAYGLGWGLRDYHGRLFTGHTGGYDGMISAVSMLPEEKLGVVVLTNGMRSPITAVTYQTLDFFLGVNPGKDWSAELLESTISRSVKDTRIADRKASRAEGTHSSQPLENYTGIYISDIYGNITVSLANGKLRLEMEHSPELSCTLKHFHHDVFEILWDLEQAWFQFGTVKFKTDNYMNITGIDFDVPNDDIFFEELKPHKAN